MTDLDHPNNEMYFEYLESLRDSGKVNMWGAGPLLAQEFEIDEKLANEILVKWIKSFGEG